MKNSCESGRDIMTCDTFLFPLMEIPKLMRDGLLAGVPISFDLRCPVNSFRKKHARIITTIMRYYLNDYYYNVGILYKKASVYFT